MVQYLGFHTSTAGVISTISGEGTEFLQAAGWPKRKSTEYLKCD